MSDNPKPTRYASWTAGKLGSANAAEETSPRAAITRAANRERITLPWISRRPA